MLLYRTSQGLARENGGMLDVLDVPYRDIAELLSECKEIGRVPVREAIPLTEAKLLAPIVGRGRIILNGLNYIDHVKEGSMRLPEAPTFLDINDSGLSDPGTTIILPAEAPSMVDYEGELVLIITRPGSEISAAKVWHHVGGLTIGNDVSARDIQRQGVDDGVLVRLDQVRRGKTFPTFKPIGPAVLVTEDLDQPLNLRVRTRVNGELRQDARTTQMIFNIPTFVEYVSRKFALEVGDLIFSGTPSGSALSHGKYLAHGDVVEVSIDGIGILRNVVAAAQTPC